MYSLMPTERMTRLIFSVRHRNVMLDVDLARLYGVPTKRLNEQVKRNRGRFPNDFMFQLTVQEKAQVVANCDHLSRLKFSPTRPYVFTEHGALMLASVLNSPVAVQVSVQVVRAFVHLREMTTMHKDLARRLKALEQKYDARFKMVFDAIRQLMAPPEKTKHRIGFHS